MIFLKLFYVFSKIGIFNFGGGYAMLSLIYSETVVKNHWLTNAEFTDIVAISQFAKSHILDSSKYKRKETSCLNSRMSLFHSTIF